MKIEHKTMSYNLYSNDDNTEEIREIKGISIMNRRKNKEGKWGTWISCNGYLARVIMNQWDKKKFQMESHIKEVKE